MTAVSPLGGSYRLVYGSNSRDCSIERHVPAYEAQHFGQEPGTVSRSTALDRECEVTVRMATVGYHVCAERVAQAQAEQAI